jgi:hypothetical protein
MKRDILGIGFACDSSWVREKGAGKSLAGRSPYNTGVIAKNTRSIGQSCAKIFHGTVSFLLERPDDQARFGKCR